jgi:hypothetical protein
MTVNDNRILVPPAFGDHLTRTGKAGKTGARRRQDQGRVRGYRRLCLQRAFRLERAMLTGKVKARNNADESAAKCETFSEVRTICASGKDDEKKADYYDHECQCRDYSSAKRSRLKLRHANAFTHATKYSVTTTLFFCCARARITAAPTLTVFTCASALAMGAWE